MLLHSLDEIKGTDREVRPENKEWVSNRLLLKKDGLGFSFNDTTVFAGTELNVWFKNHLEVCYCLEGEGEVETITDGKIYPIKPGTLYAVDKHDKHILRAKTDLRLICVFSPALTGTEVHDEDGSYPILE
jgi:L-ectoine synthase